MQDFSFFFFLFLHVPLYLDCNRSTLILICAGSRLSFVSWAYLQPEVFLYTSSLVSVCRFTFQNENVALCWCNVSVQNMLL